MRCNTSFESFTVVVAVVVTLSLLVSTAPTVFFGLVASNPRSTMPHTHHPDHIQEQVKWDFEAGRKNKWVVEHRNVPARTVRRYRYIWNETGEVYIPRISTGRPRALPEYVVLAIHTYLVMNPDAYLSEIDWIL